MSIFAAVKLKNIVNHYFMKSNLYFCHVADAQNNNKFLRNDFGNSVVLLRSADFGMLLANGFRILVVEYDDNHFYQLNKSFYTSRSRRAHACALDIISYRTIKNNYHL